MVAVSERPRRKLRRVEYDRMVEAGIFGRERLELIRGELVAVMSPIGVRHATVVSELDRWLHLTCPRKLSVRCQQPLICADDSEPEPDLAIVPFDPTRTEHPMRAVLVVEVADSSRELDLLGKAALYAESDVDEYWVIDLQDACIHVHRDRADGVWQTISIHGADVMVSPRALPDLAVSLDQLRSPTL